jgi:hypothetical protein
MLRRGKVNLHSARFERQNIRAFRPVIIELIRASGLTHGAIILLLPRLCILGLRPPDWSTTSQNFPGGQWNTKVSTRGRTTRTQNRDYEEYSIGSGYIHRQSTLKMLCLGYWSKSGLSPPHRQNSSTEECIVPNGRAIAQVVSRCFLRAAAQFPARFNR